MPPLSTAPALHLTLLPGLFSVFQLPANDKLKQVLVEKLQQPTGRFISITRTAEEVSVVEEVMDTEETTADWKCIKIKGPMDFGLTGILNDLSTPLKVASISIFAVSTWNTDYVLVKKDKAEEAVRVLIDDGWRFTTTQE